MKTTAIKQVEKYKKTTKTSLSFLWIGAMLLLLFMFYGWQNPKNEKDAFKNVLLNPKDIFIDELLLSSQDLQLNNRINLININLSKGMNDTEAISDSLMLVSPNKRRVYSRILQSKLNKVSEAGNNDGFTIKPIPK